MERVVDDRFAAGPLVVLVDRAAQRRSLYLLDERNDRGGPAASGRDRSGFEVVDVKNAVELSLVNVHVRVDTTGEHQLAGCVDGSGGASKCVAKQRDPTTLNTDVASDAVGGGHHRSVTNY